jgi:molecular chaperone HscB
MTHLGAPEGAPFQTMATEIHIPTTTDHFSFFGLPRKLNVNVDDLEKQFYRLSRKLHPDVFANASAEQQTWSMEQSSRLNDAWRTLKDPITRTQYLLELEGLKLEEQSSSATQAARETGTEKKQVVPPELLEEVFDLNMQLQELRMSKQMGEADADALAGLQNAKQNFATKLGAIDTELRSIWNHWDAVVERQADDESRKQVLQQMLDLLNRRSYIRNLVRDVNAALES